MILIIYIFNVNLFNFLHLKNSSGICLLFFVVEYFIWLFSLNFVLEGEDALPGCSEKPFQSPNLHLSPKHENVPLLNLPSILGPGKFEYNTQKLEPKYSDHEGMLQTFLFLYNEM